MGRLASTTLAATAQAAFFSGVLILTGARALPGVCLLVLFVSWTVLESAFQGAHCEAAGRREAAGPRETAYGIILFLTLILCAFGFFQVNPPPPLLPVLGIAIGGIGIAVRLAAIARLGAHFHNDVEIAPGQPLVTDGIYRFVRHPGELGILMIVLGSCVLTANPFALGFGLLFFLPCVLHRVRREDRLLATHFGIDFSGVSSVTPALIPFPGDLISEKRCSQGATHGWYE